jgi:PiT family inorganic phosphate transporter
MEALLILSALFLAFSNGANDNFKGFATVWGSDTLDYRGALRLATLATVAGSVCSLFFAEALAQQFSGKGLVPDATVNAPQFLFSVGIGAALTVFTATRAGLPVTTTHALIGALLGAGFGFNSGELRLEPSSGNVAITRSVAPTLIIASNEQCDTLTAPVSRVSLSRLADRLHIFSAALICFARGVNDTPKLAALLLGAHLLGSDASVAAIALIMASGGVLFARPG